MTKAQLTVWINWDPDDTGIGVYLPGPNVMVFDIEVTDPNEPVTITIDHEKVSMNTPHEPRLVTLPEQTVRGWRGGVDFETALTEMTTPEQVFGAPDIKSMAEEAPNDPTPDSDERP